MVKDRHTKVWRIICHDSSEIACNHFLPRCIRPVTAARFRVKVFPMKKWLIIGVSLLVVLALLAGALVITYHRVLSKNFLVAKIEESIDSRVQVGELGVNVFAIPARVVIRDVIIAERDEAAKEGVPHDERSALKGGPIRIGEIAFDLSLRELLSKRIKVSQLRVEGARVDMVMDREGKLDIEPLFAAPPEKREKQKQSKGLNAKDSADLVTELDRVLIESTSFKLIIEKTGLEIIGSDIRADFSDIRVDPQALEKVNEAQLDFAGRFEAFSSRKGRQQYGRLGLDGPARVRLFDPATGALAPDAEIEFAISKDSYVSAKAPYIIRLWQLTDALHKIGLKTDPLPDKLDFGSERVLSASYAGSRLDLREAVSLVIEDWELLLDGGSWAHFGNEEHASTAKLIAGAKVSKFVGENLKKLTDAAPEEVRAKLLQQFTTQLFVDDRLTLLATTGGPLSDPKVKLKSPLPDVKKVIAEYAKTKLFDLLIDELGK